MSWCINNISVHLHIWGWIEMFFRTRWLCVNRECKGVMSLVCFAADALDISDVTLINPDPVVSSAISPSLLCVSSDWTTSGTSSLSLGHESPEAHNLRAELDRSRHAAAKVTWMSRNHTFGVFYCHVKNSNGSKIYTYKMLSEGKKGEINWPKNTTKQMKIVKGLLVYEVTYKL